MKTLCALLLLSCLPASAWADPDALVMTLERVRIYESPAIPPAQARRSFKLPLIFDLLARLETRTLFCDTNNRVGGYTTNFHWRLNGRNGKFGSKVWGEGLELLKSRVQHLQGPVQSFVSESVSGIQVDHFVTYVEDHERLEQRLSVAYVAASDPSLAFLPTVSVRLPGGAYLIRGDVDLQDSPSVLCDLQ